ncbi:hypothetical protein NTJ12_002458 [Flavobacterium psychrophilum]|nr:hypothetical protein [Flavobacterium psychrophilum]
MASCYHCGQNGSSHRRNVTTGGSNGTYYGKSVSFSSRTYNGLRTLCANCAYDVDKGNIRSGIIGRYIIICILVFIIFKFKL